MWQWLKQRSSARRAPRRPMMARLFLEPLEERCMPSTTWTGLGANNNWNTAANWNNGVPTTNSDVVFSSTTARLTSNNNISGLTLHSISFSGTADGYVLTGNAITLNNASTTGTIAINVQGPNADEIDFAITAASNITINAGDTANDNMNAVLDLMGNLTASGSRTITFGMPTTDGTSNGVITVFGVISNGTGTGVTTTVAQAGTGTTYLMSANTFTGDTIISNGVLVAEDNASMGSGTQTVTVGSNTSDVSTSTATFGIDSGVSIPSSVSVVLNGTGAQGQGALAASSNTTLAGLITVDSTLISIDAASGNFNYTATGWVRGTTAQNQIWIFGPGSITSSAFTITSNILRIDTTLIGNVTIGSTTASGVLQGNGTIVGNVTLLNASTLIPGIPSSVFPSSNSGVLTVQGNVTLSSTSIFEVDLFGNSTTGLLSNELVLTGLFTVTSGATLNIDMTNFTAGTKSRTVTYLAYGSKSATWFGTPTYTNKVGNPTVNAAGSTSATISLTNSPS